MVCLAFLTKKVRYVKKLKKGTRHSGPCCRYDVYRTDVGREWGKKEINRLLYVKKKDKGRHTGYIYLSINLFIYSALCNVICNKGRI